MPDDLPISEDALAGGLEMSVRLNVFEGPLDLLLFLIRKNEIDIYDIPIAEVTRQYMGVLRSMKSLSLDVAGDGGYADVHKKQDAAAHGRARGPVGG